ncbi:hypothetical protein ASF11_24705 [Acidovorax sp. Leaf76]|uniref:hypothetical protein n=1 Tax=unclassified Acidovorax TaxID=2684926 RepID=UPI0007004ACF|nr:MULTISPECIES: hypothetical protein [unclassified Acidovorax]KQO20765.1 hypothetical protein ASF11_24705 [Acidovorax sp. Leaf76]KQO34028.1 hypothetical protein ASF19_24520 [Acidovorax sp. Leaf84]KQS36648.1 hypothetical protein ASG27_24790 [Acidovorax sp. Leaf191]
MNTERPIHLDLGMPASTAFEARTGNGAQTGGEPRDTDTLSDDAKALRSLLEQQRAAPPAGAAQPPSAPRPFDLFGAGAAALPGQVPQQAVQPAGTAAAAPADAPRGIGETLSQMAQRLLVGDGSTGRRSVQIQLADDSLPGVVVDIFEDGGRVVAQFTCMQESSRERLVRNAQWLADGLAERLAQGVSVRVQTDDPEDLCLVEAHAGG